MGPGWLRRASNGRAKSPGRFERRRVQLQEDAERRLYKLEAASAAQLRGEKVQRASKLADGRRVEGVRLAVCASATALSGIVMSA